MITCSLIIIICALIVITCVLIIITCALIMITDDRTLLNSTLQCSEYYIILSSKTQKPPVSHIEPPADWNPEDNPMYDSMVQYLEQHYTKDDVSRLCYHMSQVG